VQRKLLVVRRGHRAARGLTLVEFLFAISVTAVVMLGVAAMFPSALRTVVVGGHQTKASALAMEMAEAIRNDYFPFLITRYNGFDTSTLTVNCATLVPPSTAYDTDYSKKKWRCDLVSTSDQSTGRGLPYGRGVVAVTCRNANDSPNTSSPCSTELQRVVVTVYWDRNGERSVSYTTYVARRD
jgi:Tfp pilus assembly protein PilV